MGPASFFYSKNFPIWGWRVLHTSDTLLRREGKLVCVGIAAKGAAMRGKALFDVPVIQYFAPAGTDGAAEHFFFTRLMEDTSHAALPPTLSCTVDAKTHIFRLILREARCVFS